jgi:hypothetical protein
VTIANPTIVIKMINTTIALNAMTRTQKAQSSTTRRMIASAITSKKRVMRPCIMTSPLCQALAIHPKEGVSLVPDLFHVLVLGLTLAQAAGATTTIMSTKTIASQVQPSIMGFCTTRTTMTDMPSSPLQRQQRSTPRNRQLHQ